MSHIPRIPKRDPDPPSTPDNPATARPTRPDRADPPSEAREAAHPPMPGNRSGGFGGARGPNTGPADGHNAGSGPAGGHNAGSGPAGDQSAQTGRHWDSQGAGARHAAHHGSAGAGASGDPRHQRPLPGRRRPQASEPAIMLPGSVVAFLLILVAVQLYRGTLSPTEDIGVLLWFAFIPARYSAEWTGFPGGLAGDAWTFITYAFLHGSWTHLISNSVWLVAFGAAVARRFGAVRFWLFVAVTAAGGAGLHLATHLGEEIPVVGASAAVAGLMAGAARFVFDGRGPLRMRVGGDAAYRLPARDLQHTLTNRSALAFIAIFFALNLAIGFAGSTVGGVAIAWEAHLGGFLVGLLAFRLFDPIPR